MGMLLYLMKILISYGYYYHHKNTVLKLTVISISKFPVYILRSGYTAKTL